VVRHCADGLKVQKKRILQEKSYNGLKEKIKMANVAVEFSYGYKSVSVQIPEESLIKIIEVGDACAASNPDAEVRRALLKPIGTDRLSEIVRGKNTVLIMVPDRTRKFPLDFVIPPVIDEILAGGIKEENIKFLIASGTHRAMTEEEMEHHFGSVLYERFKNRIYNHEWWDENQLVHVGTTPNGTPIDINRHVLETDVKIAVGAVKPHRDAGWSGGAKMIQPGVSGFRTTGYTHWLAAQYPVSEILGHNNNVVRREMEQIAEQVGLDFIVNCVLDRQYRLSKAFAGHFIDAHRACCEAASPYFTLEIEEKADIFIVGASSGQTNMWGNATGPNWSELIMKEGGTVVLFARCEDGICDEHPDIIKYGYRPLDEVKGMVERGEITDLTAAGHLCHGAEKWAKGIRTILVSEGINREEAAKLGMEYADSPQEAVDMALARHGKNARIYAFPSFYFTEFVVKLKN